VLVPFQPLDLVVAPIVDSDVCVSLGPAVGPFFCAPTDFTPPHLPAVLARPEGGGVQGPGPAVGCCFHFSAHATALAPVDGFGGAGHAPRPSGRKTSDMTRFGHYATRTRKRELQGLRDNREDVEAAFLQEPEKGTSCRYDRRSTSDPSQEPT